MSEREGRPAGMNEANRTEDPTAPPGQDSWLRLGALIDLSHNHSASLDFRLFSLALGFLFILFGFRFLAKGMWEPVLWELWGLNFVCAYQKAFFWIKIKLIKLHRLLGFRVCFWDLSEPSPTKELQ